jgi:agmatinase
MVLVDPLARWAEFEEKPDYAGLVTFGGLPYTEDAKDLGDVDVAIVGAPMDELTSDRPGSRFGPRAIRAASCPQSAHLEARIDGLAELTVVDFGDAPVIPGRPAGSHRAIETTVREVVEAGAMPIVLGGDHSVTEPEIRAHAARWGRVGLVHFDAHTDTGRRVFGAELSHGTVMYRLVQAGLVDPSRYVQIGLRGYWPGRAEFDWQRRKGITSVFMHEIRDGGIERAVRRAVETTGSGPTVLSVDVDVMDPAFAPATGTPEPGGMTAADLLWACRILAEELELVGADIVEVSPRAHGTADITALVAERIVREVVTGIAMARQSEGLRSEGIVSST